MVEVGGAIAALSGAGLVTAAAVGAAPGSAALVYLSFLVAAAGGHVAASDPGSRAGDVRVAAGRGGVVLGEVAFVVALGTAFLRWRAAGLEAVVGAQAVLGTGLSVGPPLAAAGLAVTAVALVAAGALRLPPTGETRRGAGRPTGSAVLVTVCRWSLAGATAMVAAALVAGHPIDRAADLAAVLTFVGVALGSAVVAGALSAAVALLPEAPWRRWSGVVPLALAVTGAAMVGLA